MNSKSKQTSFFKKQEQAYGGELLKKAKARRSGRPLSTKQSIHLVMRSSLAKGTWSFKTAQNEKAVREIIQTFSAKYFVQVLSLAVVGNHLHLHIKLGKIFLYEKFIRAVTSAIAMKITGISRWKTKEQLNIKKFWDYRPFTKIVEVFQQYLNLKDYIRINQFEGQGYRRHEAQFLVRYFNST